MFLRPAPSVSRVTLISLVEDLTDGVLGVYERLLGLGDTEGDSAGLVTQNRALQVLFDIRFLASVMGRKEETEVGL